MEIKYIENGSVTSAKGFTANGICAGVKASNTTKKDLALIYCDKVCNSAAIFTKNLVKSDTIYVTKKHLENGTAQAVVVNSGNANACNPDGYEKAEKMCSLAAEALGVDENDVIVASTGVIGQPLPIDPIASNPLERHNNYQRHAFKGRRNLCRRGNYDNRHREKAVGC